jgi:hypothetical protein
MRKPIKPKVHGIIDYTTSSAVAMAPRLLNMPKRAAALCYGLAGGYTALSMLTRYPAGAKKVVPFKAHGATEAIIGAALPFMPHLMHFEKKKRARNFFYGLTAMTAAVALMTDWNATTSSGQQRKRSRRRRLAAA